MRDRAAERRLAPRTLRIDVNPLVIAGRVGETVDATLIDLDPAARERLGADERTQRLRRRDQRQRDVAHALAPCGSRNPKITLLSTMITVSPAPLTPIHSVDTMPRSGLLADTRLSRIF